VEQLPPTYVPEDSFTLVPEMKPKIPKIVVRRGRPRRHENDAARQRAFYGKRKRAAQRQQDKVWHRSQQTTWETPPPFFAAINRLFHCTLDVAADPQTAKCARYFTPTEDGLAQEWPAATVWMNPPYKKGLIDRWVEKAYKSSLCGTTVVSLVPARVGSLWWRTYVRQGEIHEVPTRLAFLLDGQRKDSAAFPCVLVIFYPPEAPRVPSATVEQALLEEYQQRTRRRRPRQTPCLDLTLP
jgi:phage N-6-adenine-methyltransferase